MDFTAARENSPQVVSDLHSKHTASDGTAQSDSLWTRVQKEIAEVPTAVTAGAGLAIGLVARMPGEFGMVGKVTAATLGLLATSDAVSRSFSPYNQEAYKGYVNDGAFLGSLSAGLLLGGRFFGGTARAMSQDLTEQLPTRLSLSSRTMIGDATARDAVNASLKPMGRAGGSNIINISDYLPRAKSGATSMIEEGEIGKFSADRQAEIRQTIADMVKRGYKARHLMLSEEGSVLLDHEAIDIEREAAALKDL